jgi:hypothetical protein
MKGRHAPLLAALLLSSACHGRRPDHAESKAVPPPVHEELTWESFFHEPWPDPLHEKYEDLFGKPYPNPGRQHFDTARPFADVKKFGLAFDETAVPGARAETESAAGMTAVSLQLPDSAGRAVAVRTEDKVIALSVDRPLPARRYRLYRSDEVVVPLPPGADPDTARVVRDGDWVRIKFHDLTP